MNDDGPNPRDTEADWRYRCQAWEQLKPGDTVAYAFNGKVHKRVVTGITHHGSEPAVYPVLSRWQRTVRRVTPRRWRKPIQPVRAAKPAAVTLATAHPIVALIDQLTSKEAP